MKKIFHNTSIISMPVLLICMLLSFSCKKENIGEYIPCTMAYYISEKFTKDTALLKIDTLWKDCISGKELDSVRARGVQWIPFCFPPNPSMPTFILEKTYYTIK